MVKYVDDPKIFDELLEAAFTRWDEELNCRLDSVLKIAGTDRPKFTELIKDAREANLKTIFPDEIIEIRG